MKELRWWWLSFANEDGFLGGATVGPSDDFIGAVQLAHSAGFNPGGEVCGVELPPGPAPLEKYRNRLLSYEEIAAMDKELLGEDATRPATWEELTDETRKRR